MFDSENINHYIEIFYPYNPDRGTQEDFIYCTVINNRNPLLYIEEYNGANGFRFFDLNVSDSPLNKKKRKNVSPIYYIGRFLTEEEINKVHEIMPYTSTIYTMVECHNGCLITDLNAGDIAIGAYTNMISKNSIAKSLKR